MQSVSSTARACRPRAEQGQAALACLAPVMAVSVHRHPGRGHLASQALQGHRRTLAPRSSD